MSFKEIVKESLNYVGLLAAFLFCIFSFFCKGRKAKAERKQIINRELEEKLFSSVVQKGRNITPALQLILSHQFQEKKVQV